MRRVELVVAALASTLFVGCGLMNDVPRFVGVAQGEACGPCGVGVVAADERSCDLQGLSETVSPDASCEAIVFVGNLDGGDGGEGTLERPFGPMELPAALDKAADAGASVVVLLDDVQVSGPLRLVDGVSVVGGFRKDGTFSRSVRPQILTTGAGAAVTGLLAESIERPTIVRQVVIRTQGDARSHYGSRVVNSRNIRFERVRMEAGAGGDGARGADGVDGADGSDGVNAGSPRPSNEGAGGTNPACGLAGGDGGAGAVRSNGSTIQEAESGETSGEGVFGGFPGQLGDDGDSGADGEDGIKTASVGEVRDGVWVSAAPTAGEDGGHGESGGGGGGGTVSAQEGIGGGGGGGGAGGCGGLGGDGGQPGGSSIALLLDASEVVLTGAELVAGDGGGGGAGGAGGDGGRGGSGGLGAGGEDGNSGGDGGRGGSGGDGGDGAPGVGGSSVGVVCGPASAVEAYEDVSIQIGEGGLSAGGSNPATAAQSFGCDSL